MSRAAAITLAVMLAACNSSDEQPETSYSWPNDVHGVTGITLHAPNAITFVSFEEIESEWRDVSVCAVPGIVAPGPRVEFRSFKQMGLGGAWGVFTADGTVYVNSDEGPAGRNRTSDRETLRHEFVHYALWVSGHDWKHANPAFVRCDALGAATCDGVVCEP